MSDRAFHRWSPAHGWWTMVRPRAALLVGIGLCLAASGVVVAAVGMPDMAIVTDPVGGRVRSVVSGGPAWRDGLRPGQIVVALQPGSQPVDWRIVTRADGLTFASSAAAHVQELRALVPVQLLALAAGLVAAMALVRWTRPAAAAGALIGVVGAIPIVQAGLDVSIAASLGALFLPVLWLEVFGGWPRRSRWLVLGAAVAVSAAWLLARALGSSVFDAVDTSERAATLAASVTVAWMGYGLGPGALAVRLRRLPLPTAIDLVSLAGAIAAVAVLALLDRLFWPPVLLVFVTAVVLYPRWRRLSYRALARLITSEVRERAAMGAVEDERRRLANEIHDSSLQELAGVIQRLEMHPETEQEAAALRGVARELRDVVTDLHPPVLQDLGLAPALAVLVDGVRQRRPTFTVRLEVDNRTGALPAQRLPRDVELAGYRVVQEALNNSVLHSGGTGVSVHGLLEPGLIDLVIVDDGCGVTEGRLAEAYRAGHLGVASMRQRALAVSGELAMRSGPTGTEVRFQWRRG